MHDATPFARRIACVCAIALALAAGPRALVAQESFVATHFATLSNTEAVPANDDPGDGLAIFQFTPAAGTLQYRLTVTFEAGDTLTTAEFRQGAEGEVGPVLHAIPFTPGSQTATGTWSGLTAQEMQALGSASVYVNVNTTRHPNGQIRAQVNPLPNMFAQELTPDAETPAVTGSQGTGHCPMWLDLANHVIAYHLEWDSLTGPPTMAHFHLGNVGVKGGVVHPIALPPGAGVKGSLEGTWDNLTEADIANLRSGRIYVNIHTAANPQGEIRGQVYTYEVFTAAISPTNQVPPISTSSMQGTGLVAVRGDSNIIAYCIVNAGTGPIIQGHIHKAAIGANGGIIIPFIGIGAIWGILDPTATISEADWNAMRSTETYVNFHTQENTAGEARGQLIGAAANMQPLAAAVPAADADATSAALTAWYDRGAESIRFRIADGHRLHGASVVLYSSLGERIGSSTIEAGLIPTGSLASGAYFAQLVADGVPVAVCRIAIVR